MSIVAAPVVSPGADALTRDRLRHVDQHYLRAETMAAANTVAESSSTAARWHYTAVASLRRSGTRVV